MTVPTRAQVAAGRVLIVGDAMLDRYWFGAVDRIPPEAAVPVVPVTRAAQPLHRYRCAACAFEAQHYFWQCPGCLSWDSYPPQRLEDL